MSYQVGQTLHLTAVFNGLPAGVPVTYIWEFPWDRSVAATTVPTYEKVLNKGGDPANGQLLYFTVTAALPDGQHLTNTQSVAVNWPPMIVPSPTVSKNDAAFPFNTEIALTAWDVEQGGAIAFVYTLNGTNIGTGVQTATGVFTGTYDGTVVNVYGTNSVFARTVQSAQTIRVHVIDDQGGTRAIDFALAGRAASAPVIGFSSGPAITAVDDAVRPSLRIGPGQFASFAVYAGDATAGPFEFLWTFAGSNGWLANVYSAGTTDTAPSGAVRNQYQKALAGETAGQKQVVVSVRSTATGLSAEELIGVTLIANSAGSNADIRAYSGALQLADGAEISAGTKVKYTAVVDDPQGDIASYRWQFTQPSPVSPSTLTLYGAEVLLDTTGYPAASTVQGTLRTTDRLGATATFTLSPTLRIA